MTTKEKIEMEVFDIKRYIEEGARGEITYEEMLKKINVTARIIEDLTQEG